MKTRNPIYNQVRFKGKMPDFKILRSSSIIRLLTKSKSTTRDGEILTLDSNYIGFRICVNKRILSIIK